MSHNSLPTEQQTDDRNEKMKAVTKKFNDWFITLPEDERRLLSMVLIMNIERRMIMTMQTEMQKDQNVRKAYEKIKKEMLQ